jgi:hypothetical protein
MKAHTILLTDPSYSSFARARLAMAAGVGRPYTRQSKSDFEILSKGRYYLHLYEFNIFVSNVKVCMLCHPYHLILYLPAAKNACLKHTLG